MANKLSTGKSLTESLKKQSEAVLPTDRGVFDIQTYAIRSDERMPIIVLMSPNLNVNDVVNVRIHSECLTGDLFASQRCDCGEQLHFAQDYIHNNGGIIIYLRQEGRGIGIINKLKAYNKQDEGLDTLEANLALGFHADDRSYEEAIEILRQLGVNKINLLTNNPSKMSSFEHTEIQVNKRIPIEVPAKEANIEYLKTKKMSFGHLLKISDIKP